MWLPWSPERDTRSSRNACTQQLAYFAPNNRIHAPNRSIDMHPKGIDMHPNVSIYFAPNNRILSQVTVFENGPLPIGCKVCGSWVQVYAYFWVHVYVFWVHVYGSVGCKVCGSWVQSIWILLGACLCLLGACLWIGWVHVCGCWVQVYGDVWVHVYAFCHIQVESIRIMSCGKMQQQKHPNQQAQLLKGDLGGHPLEMRSSLENHALLIQMQ